LRKPTPYETVLGEPVPTEKTELIKEWREQNELNYKQW
jgi:hypothetical protein